MLVLQPVNKHIKPDPEPYLTAARGMSLDTKNVAFVAATPTYLEGASEVGMRTIALNHTIPGSNDACIDSIEQLIELLDAAPARAVVA